MPLLMRRLGVEDIEKLGLFFVRNDRPAVTNHFQAFSMNLATAADLLYPGRHDLFFIMEDEGRFMAFSMLRGYDEGYAILSFGIFVDIDLQCRGYGRRMTEWTLRWADQLGCKKIRLTVFENNLKAQKLYEQLGFTETGRSVNAKGNNSIVMHRNRRSRSTSVFVSTQSLPSKKEQLSDRLKQWAGAGIHNIELSNYRIDHEEDFFASTAGFSGQLMLHHFFPAERDDLVLNLSSTNPLVRNETLSFFKRSIDWSARLGAPFFSFHAGYVSDPMDRDVAGFVLAPVSKKAYEIAWSLFAAGIRELANHAATYGMVLLIENNVVTEINRDKLLLSRPDEFVRFFNEMNIPDNIAILLDWGHWLVTARTYQLPLDSISQIKDRVRGLHLHTNNGLTDEHRPFTLEPSGFFMLRDFHPDFITQEGHYNTLAELQNDLIKMERAFS